VLPLRALFQIFCWWANQYGSFKKKVKSCERAHDLIKMSHTTHWLHQLQKLSCTYIYIAEISVVEFSPCAWVLVWPSTPLFDPQFQCFIPNPPRIWTNSWATAILWHLFRKEPERNFVLISSSSPSELTPTKRRPLKKGGCIPPSNWDQKKNWITTISSYWPAFFLLATYSQKYILKKLKVLKSCTFWDFQ
jgi:hypothetical protein